MFGSIFIAIGAACTELKDAQGMMTPAMLILMLPWIDLVRRSSTRPTARSRSGCRSSLPRRRS